MCSYTLPMLIRGWHTTRVKGKYANSNPSFSCSLLKWLSLQCAIHRIAIMIAQSLSCCVVALKSNLIKHKFKLRGCERSRRWYDAANLLKGDQCVVCVCVWGWVFLWVFFSFYTCSRREMLPRPKAVNVFCECFFFDQKVFWTQFVT